MVQLGKYSSVTFSIALGSFSAVTSAQIPQGQACTAHNRPDVILQPHEVLGGRIPTVGLLNVSDACKAESQPHVDRWRDQDRAQFTQLLNHACSAALGWVEKVPGTCQAGGPPPICPANHWERRPADAKAAFAKKARETLIQRQKELVRAACSCERAALAAAAAYPVSGVGPVPTPPSATGLVVPCASNATAGSTCPPGMRCQSGYCQATLSVVTTWEFAKGLVTSVGQEAAEKAIAHSVGVLGKVFQSLSWRVFSNPYMELFASTETGLWRNSYETSLNRMHFRMSHLRELHNEYANFLSGLPARGSVAILKDLDTEKNGLNQDVQLANEYYYGVVREQELGDYGCYEVLEFHHQQAMQAFANVMSLSPSK